MNLDNSQFNLGAQAATTGAGTYVAPPAQPSIVASAQPPVEFPVYKAESSPVKTIIIVILVLICLGLSALSAYLYIQYSDVRTDVDGQINNAVIEAEHNLTLELQKQFEEQEKLPNRTFSGPEDYGNLSFPYPKTWSLYEEKDASSGTGDYVAYLNPLGVPAGPAAATTVTAITVTIKSAVYEKVNASYETAVKKGTMTATTRYVNGGSAQAVVYRGIVKKDFDGIVVLMKIRDKTAIIQTDSAEVFGADLNKILDNLTFNS